MNDQRSETDRPGKLTRRQEAMEAYLRSRRPLPPTWSEEDVLAARPHRRNARVRTAWPIVAAWLCGLAAGVLIMVAAQGMPSTESMKGEDRVAARTDPEPRAVVEPPNDSNDAPATPGDSVATIQSRASIPAWDPSLGELTAGTLYAGATWRTPHRPVDSVPAQPLPSQASRSDASGTAYPQRDLPLLTPSPVCQRELLRRLGAIDVASLTP